MKMQEMIVNVIFDAGKGYTPVASREGVCGKPFGELPKPTRGGYTFEGWHLDGREITAETVLESEEDVRLTAQWVRKKSKEKKPSIMRKQKIVAFALAVAIVFLGVGIAVANRLVAIYHIEDEYIDASGQKQSDRYTVKRENGVYKMFDRDGKLMEYAAEHSYQSNTEEGVWYNVYVAETSGNQYMINSATGAYELFAVVDYDDSLGESLGGTVKNKRIMMFPRVGQDNTYSIKVTNEHGTYELYRQNVLNTDATKGKKYTTSVQIRGTEGTLTTYDPTLFASLCVSCGYTLTMQKLYFDDPETPRDENGNVKYGDYGLENVYDENGKLTYAPAVYTITKAAYDADGHCTPATETVTVNGESVQRTVEYTVKVGYPILSGGGYYVQLDGRDAVYIVSADIADTVLQPVESLVTPTVIYPMTVSTYVMPYNFRLGTIKKFLDVDDDKLTEDGNMSLIATFDYKDLAKRENSIESSVPYVNDLKFMAGYLFDSNSVSTVLERLYSMEFLGCKKLGPTDADFEKYGLTENVYMLTFDYDPAIAKGGSEKENWVNNLLIISQRSEDGTFYIYSYLYDMIVEVDEYYLSFLDWEESHWYNQYFFQNNIAYMKSMCITVGGKAYDFKFDNRFSYAYYDKGDGTGAMVDLTKGTLTETANGYLYTVTKTGKQHNAYLMDFTAGRTYRDENTGKILYKGQGDSGEITVEVSSGSTNMKVSCNDALLDYTITVEEDSGYTGTTKTKTYTAMDNFRRLYSKLLWYSIEGDADLTELGSDLKTYVTTHAPVATIQYSLEDMASILNPENFKEGNNKQSAVIRFYEYPGSERKLLLTIEVLEDENATPDPAKGEGKFYTLASELDGLESYLEKLLRGELLPSST